MHHAPHKQRLHPVPEAIVHDCGLIAAIGRCAGLRHATVNRHLRTLVDAGSLGRTHTCADTGRAAVGKRSSSPQHDPDTCDQQ